jgi:hypothetical protein
VISSDVWLVHTKLFDEWVVETKPWVRSLVTLMAGRILGPES